MKLKPNPKLQAIREESRQRKEEGKPHKLLDESIPLAERKQLFKEYQEAKMNPFDPETFDPDTWEPFKDHPYRKPESYRK